MGLIPHRPSFETKTSTKDKKMNMQHAEKAEELIEQAVRCTQQIKFEQQCVRDLREIARTELGCDPKDFNAYVKQVLAGLKAS
jgi:hypothetical protein